MNSSEIRKEFLRFFEGENHKVLPSASLVADDPTLLFINAGMAPLKQYFFKRDEGITRATTVQKCLRTNDLEMVGKTNRHHTFFEMLGNFSFGDYFKKEACAWGWEFVTEKMNIPGDELWVTIYTGDTEASDAWKKLGIREERIVQFKENFWTMGETGPCGPCSEIIVDRGAGKGCGRKECDITCTCDRFIELWNLVFTQFDRQKDGSLVPLKQKNIDTGMGLERLTALVQGADSAFETDLFKPVIGYLAERYNLAPEIHTTALRVVSDHVRAAAFLISEGIYPSNEGRGYVLRRILRRAIRYGKKWDSGPFLYRLVPAVVEIMKDAYPELLEKREYASRVLLDEEKSFDATLNHGIRILQEIIEGLKKKGSPEIPGSDAFRLYDTYGMPLDFVKEIASENEMRVDEEGYAQEMGRQRSRSRESREKKEFTVTGTAGDSFSKFVGYDTMRSDTKIKALFRDEKEIDAVSSGEECIAVLVETPFYGESGGQIGDTGSLSGGSSKADVIDTQKPGLHRIKVLEGKISREDCVTAQVDAFRRSLIARHHTGTHLLQAALRQVLGMHVEQRGSLVTAEYLRFDFTHVPVIDKTELDKIEETVNRRVAEDLDVGVACMTLREAKEKGALAIFQEKYEEGSVRMVSIGEPFISRELCGGTHVRKTGEIGLIKITGHEGVAKGIRRITAACSLPAYLGVRAQLDILHDISGILNLPADKAVEGVKELRDSRKALETQIKHLRGQMVQSKVPQFIENKESVDGVYIVAGQVEHADHDALADLYESIEKKLKPSVGIFGAVLGEKVIIVGRASRELKEKVHMGEVMKGIAAVIGGGGGGDQVRAQAQGKDKTRIGDAIENAKKIVKDQLSKGG